MKPEWLVIDRVMRVGCEGILVMEVEVVVSTETSVDKGMSNPIEVAVVKDDTSVEATAGDVVEA